jgi:hypothetical protein
MRKTDGFTGALSSSVCVGMGAGVSAGVNVAVGRGVLVALETIGWVGAAVAGGWEEQANRIKLNKKTSLTKYFISWFPDCVDFLV